MKREAQFVICIGNKGYAASLELRKIYQVIPDKVSSKLHQIRVIDESGEDYIYPEGSSYPHSYSGRCIGPRHRLAISWEGNCFGSAVAGTKLDGFSR